MGCINVKVSTNEKGINVKPIDIVVTPFICYCDIECTCQGKINVAPQISSINIKCGIVCSLADVLFIKVSPQEVQWITDNDAIVYNVESNTNWTIITS